MGAANKLMRLLREKGNIENTLEAYNESYGKTKSESDLRNINRYNRKLKNAERKIENVKSRLEREKSRLESKLREIDDALGKA